MILLKRKLSDGTYFEFDKILSSGYSIQEDYDRTTQKFVNGNRKQIISEYIDVQIEIELGTLDSTTTKEYLENLVNGEYQYYSLKSKTMKSANFLLKEIPEITIERAYDEVYNKDFKITLLKASDIDA